MRLGLSAAVWRQSILFHNGGTVGRFVIPVLLFFPFLTAIQNGRETFSLPFLHLLLYKDTVLRFSAGRCVCCANSRFAMPFAVEFPAKHIKHITHRTRRRPNPKGAFPARPGEHHSVVRCMAGNRKAFLFCGSNSGESAADLVRIAVEGVELLGNLLFQHEAEVGVIHRVGVRGLRLCRLV